MTDYIVIAILVVVLAIGIYSTVKHFKGQSECCGGSTYKARKKKLDNVVAKKVFVVEGMSCQNCVNRVMEAVNDMDGASAIVNLKKGTVTVSMDHVIEDEVIKNAIEKRGYKVIEIKG